MYQENTTVVMKTINVSVKSWVLARVPSYFDQRDECVSEKTMINDTEMA